jgi:hypothetical protein
MSGDIEQQLKQDFVICEYLKLQLHGSTYVYDVLGLVDFILIFFSIDSWNVLWGGKGGRRFGLTTLPPFL